MKDKKRSEVNECEVENVMDLESILISSSTSSCLVFFFLILSWFHQFNYPLLLYYACGARKR